MGKNGWYFVLFVVFGIIPGWVFFKTDSVMSTYAIDAKQSFAAGAVPASYKVLNSIAGSGGNLFEFYESDERTKFSLLVSQIPSQSAGPGTPAQALKTLVDRQRNRFVDQPTLAHFTQGYLGSSFDPRRAYDVALVGSKTPAIKFITAKGANYGFSIWRVKGGLQSPSELASTSKVVAPPESAVSGAISYDREIALLVMKKNEAVSGAVLDRFVSVLKPEIQPVFSESQTAGAAALNAE